MNTANTKESQEKILVEEEEAVEDALTAAALDSAETLVVKSETADETELDDFDFMENLEDITSALEISVQVLTFDNPSDAEKPLKFAMRQITSDEHAAVFNTMLDMDMMEKVLSEALENADEEQAKEETVQKMIASVSGEDALQRQADREVAVVFKCMLRPKKKTVKAIKRLPKAMRRSLFEACTQQINRVWTFQ